MKKIKLDKGWQPQFNDNAKVVGHEKEDAPYSFQIWKKKSNLLEDFPKCIPIKVEVEEATYMD